MNESDQVVIRVQGYVNVFTGNDDESVKILYAKKEDADSNAFHEGRPRIACVRVNGFETILSPFIAGETNAEARA